MIGFVIKGRPYSVQATAARLAEWKRTVADAARPKFPVPLDQLDVRIQITFFYNTLPDFDTDNISKPICDALNGIAYADDHQLCERIVRRRDINGAFRIRGVSPELAVAIAEGNDFVSIEIDRPGPDEVNQP